MKSGANSPFPTFCLLNHQRGGLKKIIIELIELSELIELISYCEGYKIRETPLKE